MTQNDVIETGVYLPSIACWRMSDDRLVSTQLFHTLPRRDPGSRFDALDRELMRRGFVLRVDGSWGLP